MGRGLGEIQLAAMTAIGYGDRTGVTVQELASALGVTEPRARAVVASLKRRGLVETEFRSLGHRGVGEYGPATTERRTGRTWGNVSPPPRAVPPFDWKFQDGRDHYWYETETLRKTPVGMPTPVLQVSLPRPKMSAEDIARARQAERQAKESR